MATDAELRAVLANISAPDPADWDRIEAAADDYSKACESRWRGRFQRIQVARIRLAIAVLAAVRNMREAEG